MSVSTPSGHTSNQKQCTRLYLRVMVDIVHDSYGLTPNERGDELTE